ncbi:MAG: radical SAM family heme chaperone HemW [Treponema sp.]|nr:radical SAM family heme chaperone HemW [Treponema sp.]
MSPEPSAGVYSLYVHVPFCRSFCDYCDFYSVRAEPGEGGALPERYFGVLAADARRLFEDFPPVAIPTIYIGGGTPSVLGAEGISRLFAALGELPAGAGDREWTVEANPESLDAEFLRACRKAGVNRLSLGVQSFSPRSRALVHRGGPVEAVCRALELAAEFFPRSFSADLLAGLPGQDEEGLLGDIARLLGYNPAHVSLYALSLEEGTPLWDRAAELPPPDQADRLWISGRDALEGAGYRQYEVSNFSPPGRESRHNLRYWGMKNWLALGPSGSGTLIDDREGTGLRLTWPADLESWLAGGPDRLRTEPLDRLTLMKESLLMGFRCIRGPDAPLFKRRFGCSPEEAIPKTLAKWRGRGLVISRDAGPEPDSGPALNGAGLLFLNAFLVDAFEELEHGARRGFAPRGSSA